MASRWLQEEAHVDVYLADCTASIHYPYRVQRYNSASPTVHDNSDKHIVDSNINGEAKNDSIVEKAEYLGADVVVPSDVIGDCRKSIERTIDMCERIDMTDMSVVVPIQSINDSHARGAKAVVREIESTWSDKIHSYAVGGIKEKGFDGQRGAIEECRAVVGDDTHLHMFGAGLSLRWAKFINENPDMVDSIDMSTPMRIPINSDFVDYSFSRIHINQPRGKHSSFPKALQAEAICCMFNYIISGGPNDDELEQLYADNGLV